MLIANNILKMKPKKKNTEWYQKNKKNMQIVPYVLIVVIAPLDQRIILTNHIYSKHTEEKDRPFQCPHKGCNRRFAKKVH